jgi:glutamate racemase
MMTKDNPIAIFDSGVGGLTVMREIMTLMPNENIIYFGDTARIPYGIKSGQTVKRFALENCRFLSQFHPKHIVVACNTASSVALEYLRGHLSVGISGVIQPGAQAAVRTTASRIGVIGTETTIASNAYRDTILSFNGTAQIFSRSCPLLVPLVEEGWPENHPVVREALSEYLSFFDGKPVEVLILGCTHYPLLKNAIRARMGQGVRVIDSAEETAKGIAETLKETDSLKIQTTPPSRKYYVTDNPERFAAIGERVLGARLDSVTLVSPEDFFAEKGVVSES